MTFTAQDLERIAERHGCSVPDLKKRWIIQSGKSFYVMGKDGNYKSPIMKGELAQSLLRDLQRVPDKDTSPAGIEWYKKGKGETILPRSVDEILYDHCGHARAVVADMTREWSHFDAASEVFHEAVCPLAPLEGTYHAPIDTWLRLLGGNQSDRLLDWIATLSRLDRPSCALLLTGKAGAGKEMLAQGLARRWRRARNPSEIERVLDGFNEDLTRCPLVFCDETLPTKHGKKIALGDLKKMIAASSRTLARKFLSNADLVGAIRLIVAANTDRILTNHEDQTRDEQESVAIRFLHLRVGEDAADYLRSIGGRSATEAWVAGRQIAEHAIWLEENRSVSLGSRFVVEGDASDVERQLVVNNRFTSLVLEWIVRHIDDGGANSRHILVGNGAVLVNTAAVLANWSQYIRSDFVPSTTRVGTALSNVSSHEQRITWTIDGKPREIRYHTIRLDHVEEWVRQNQIGDVEALRQRVSSPLNMEEMRKTTTGVNGHAPAPAATAGVPAPHVGEAKSLFDA